MELVSWKAKNTKQVVFNTTFWKKFRTTKNKKTNELIISTTKIKYVSVNITKFVHALKLAAVTIWYFKCI